MPPLRGHLSAPLASLAVLCALSVAGAAASCATKIPQPPIVAAAGEAQAACAVVQGGRVHCWIKDVGFWIPEVADALSVAAFEPYGCAVRRAGVVSCWRYSRDLGQQRVDVKSVKLDAPSRIIMTNERSCAIVAGGRVVCWDLDPYRDRPMVPTPIPSYGEVVDFAMYCATAMALRSDGSIKPSTNDIAPATVIPDVVQVALGDHFACVRTRPGKVFCWGDNWMGRLGDGTWNPHTAPRSVPGLSEVAEIAVGIGHACARHVDGAVTCWGSNQFGQVGVKSKGLGDARPTPVRIPGLFVQSLTAVANGTCATTPAHELVCWGYNHGPRRMEVSAPKAP